MSDPVGIDIDILMDAACGDQDLAIDLVKLFFDLTGQEQIRLADAVAQGNAPSASDVAHKIAGSCASCGMSELAARCRELELLCKKAIPDDVSGRLKEINQGIQEVRCGLETHFNCSLAP